MPMLIWLLSAIFGSSRVIVHVTSAYTPVAMHPPTDRIDTIGRSRIPGGSTYFIPPHVEASHQAAFIRMAVQSADDPRRVDAHTTSMACIEAGGATFPEKTKPGPAAGFRGDSRWPSVFFGGANAFAGWPVSIVSRCHSIRGPSALAHRLSVAKVGFRFNPISSLWTADSVLVRFEYRDGSNHGHDFVQDLEGRYDKPVGVHTTVDQTVLREEAVGCGLRLIVEQHGLNLVFGQVVSPHLCRFPGIVSERPR
jgi:hypothetical protein